MRYTIQYDIMLSFIHDGEQHDYIIGPQDGGYLDLRDHTIWYIKDSHQFESITTANAINLWLNSRKIVPL